MTLLFYSYLFFCFINIFCFALVENNNDFAKSSGEKNNKASEFEKINATFNDNDFLKLAEKLAQRYVPDEVKNIYSSAESCSNHSFPYSISIDKGSTPIVQCGSLRCMKSIKIECTKNVPMNKCKGCRNWVAGFGKQKNGDLEVECCQYSDFTFTKFLKQISFGNISNYELNILVQNEKLYAFEYFNNFTMVTKNNETIYTASLYQMSCPFDANLNESETNIDNPIIAQYDANYMTSEIHGLEARARTQYPRILNYLPPKFDLTTILHQAHSGLSRENAIITAAASRYMISKKIKKSRFAYLYNHLTMEYAINLLPMISQEQKKRIPNLSFLEMFKYYSSQFPKSPFFCY